MADRRRMLAAGLLALVAGLSDSSLIGMAGAQSAPPHIASERRQMEKLGRGVVAINQGTAESLSAGGCGGPTRMVWPSISIAPRGAVWR